MHYYVIGAYKHNCLHLINLKYGFTDAMYSRGSGGMHSQAYGLRVP